MMSLIDRYIELLRSQTGDSFERAITTRLGQAVLGFQPVPRKPQGDGGLDGFSHKGSRAYCCYGPEPPKTPKQYESAIIRKFSEDLRRLFEVEPKGRGNLVERPNDVLSEVLPRGRKISSITLVVNWFESNKILGPVHTNAMTYGKCSSCKFVVNDPNLRLIGPVEFAHEYPVDEANFASIVMWDFTENVQSRAKTLGESIPSDFDEKMNVLQQIRPDKGVEIENLSESLRSSWRMALGLEYELLDTLPQAHAQLERARRQLQAGILRELLSDDVEAWQKLDSFAERARSMLNDSLEGMPVPSLLMDEVSNGEVARLIGECSINWRLT